MKKRNFPEVSPSIPRTKAPCGLRCIHFFSFQIHVCPPLKGMASSRSALPTNNKHFLLLRFFLVCEVICSKTILMNRYLQRILNNRSQIFSHGHLFPSSDLQKNGLSIK